MTVPLRGLSLRAACVLGAAAAAVPALASTLAAGADGGAGAAVAAASPALDPGEGYALFLGMNPRIAVWIIAELHLMFGAFVLGVPIFASVVEVAGVVTREARYDRLAHEFTRLLSAAFATTASLGALFAFVLFTCYPRVMNHLTGVFGPTFSVYALLFFAEAFTLYVYAYGWDRMQGRGPSRKASGIGAGLAILAAGALALRAAGVPLAGGGRGEPWMEVLAILGLLAGLGFLARGRGSKVLHVYLGFLLNLAGTCIMLVANSWTAYMMSPPGLDAQLQPAVDALGNATHWVADGAGQLQYTGPLATLHDAFVNFLWMPLNVHRLLANVAFGGTICGAYAAVRFLGARGEEDRAHYDWMGYVGNFVAMLALIPLPFAGYYLGREIYSYSTVMGQDMMGGTFSWSFIIQAFLIGGIFVSGNFYLWAGMKRIPGAERYLVYVPALLLMLMLSFAVWMTPHNLKLGGVEERFGLMPAKNAVVNAILLATFVSFLLYRRSNRGEPVRIRSQPWTFRLGVPLAGVFGILMLLYGLFFLPSTVFHLPGAWCREFSDTDPQSGIARLVELRLGPLRISTASLGASIPTGADEPVPEAPGGGDGPTGVEAGDPGDGTGGSEAWTVGTVWLRDGTRLAVWWAPLDRDAIDAGAPLVAWPETPLGKPLMGVRALEDGRVEIDRAQIAALVPAVVPGHVHSIPIVVGVPGDETTPAPGPHGKLHVHAVTTEGIQAAEGHVHARLAVPAGISAAATLRWTMYVQVLAIVAAVVLTLRDRGRAAQALLLGTTLFLAVLWLGQHGFTVLDQANLLVRHVAVSQVLLVATCLIVVFTIDLTLYRGAPVLGAIRWGQMHARSQYALVLQCTCFVLLMALMGYIRSGLRKAWHVNAILEDSSPWAGTPDLASMGLVVGSITILFLGLVAFVFFTASLGRQGGGGRDEGRSGPARTGSDAGRP